MRSKQFLKRCAKDSLAMLMVGEACVTLMDPKAHVRLYMGGPKAWRKFLSTFIEHPWMTRSLAIAELSAGMWLARHLYHESPIKGGELSK